MSEKAATPSTGSSHHLLQLFLLWELSCNTVRALEHSCGPCCLSLWGIGVGSVGWRVEGGVRRVEEKPGNARVGLTQEQLGSAWETGAHGPPVLYFSISPPNALAPWGLKKIR